MQELMNNVLILGSSSHAPLALKNRGLVHLADCLFLTHIGVRGIYPDFLCRRLEVRFPDLLILDECTKGTCLCNLLQLTQPNDQETTIEG